MMLKNYSPLPPDWVMKQLVLLRDKSINKRALSRQAGLGKNAVGRMGREPYMCTRATYNKIAVVMGWREWTDDE